jgi:hypothetical protein
MFRKCTCRYPLCAANGIYCFILGTISTLIFDKLLPISLDINDDVIFHLNFVQTTNNLFSSIAQLLPKKQPTLSWIFCISIGTFFIAWLWARLAYFRYCFMYKTWHPKLHLAYQVLSDSPMDKLLFKASQDRSKDCVLMLYLDDRKVYLGKVISMGEPNELEGPDQEVTLLPVLSGYRRTYPSYL